jgi:phenylpropionate dioxygenase-like ring-hydroxylating dioxygenase large terminal subunit
MALLLDDASVAQRVLDHIDHGRTDVGVEVWCEPVAHYRSPERLAREVAEVFHTTPTPFCPSAALAAPGAYVARRAGGIPILAVRGMDGQVSAFRNACRHRGAEVVRGSGQAKAFTCPYHAWTYGLDGTLRGVPHECGFPGLDKAAHGLVPVHAEEHGGLVFITQDGEARVDPDIPTPMSPDLRLIKDAETFTETNWKISAEGFLEGYHIMPTHRETFFPVQYDNLNVVEHFGRNNRITFPYRNVEKLRGVDVAQWRVGGVLTYVYHYFPNVLVATFPKRMVMVVLEPEGVDRTRTVNYELARETEITSDRPAVERAADFVDAGAREDRAVVESIQRGMASGANTAFTFGLFEAAIVHFHKSLHELLGDGD